MVLPVSMKVGLGYNCPMLNVYDVAPRVRRINRNNQLDLPIDQKSYANTNNFSMAAMHAKKKHREVKCVNLRAHV